MTDVIGASQLQAVSISELRRYLLSNGFSSRGSWGKFLERFHLRDGRKEFDVLVPNTRDIADYADRIMDALYESSKAVAMAPAEVLRNVIVSNHKVFRLRAHPGASISSIPFDEGYGILKNAKMLIQASAISAYSPSHRKVIRGRYSSTVDGYMDRVRLGQSDVGSYIFNLLLPCDHDLLDSDEPAAEKSDSVALTLQSSVELAAEIGLSKRVPSNDRLREVGLSANFCDALYNIVDWSDNVEIGFYDVRPQSALKAPNYVFDRGVLSVLERTSHKLAPEERQAEKTVSGTITRLSEPANKRRGSLDLLCEVDGRRRSVRVNFTASDRDIVIASFKEKSSRMLTVTGLLRTERNGHLALDEAHSFDASRRGSLL
jgi:hypothetical protein